MRAFFGSHRAYTGYLREAQLDPKSVILVRGPESVQGYAERLEPVFSGEPMLLGKPRWDAYDYIVMINHQIFPEEEPNA